MLNDLDFSSIKLVAMDMDGTALTSEHSLSARTIAAVRDVNNKKNDVKIIFATGRMLDAVKKHLQDAGMEGVVVAHNGALIVDLKNNFVYKDARVVPEIVKAVYSYSRNNDIILHYNMKDQVLVENTTPLSHRYADELGITLLECDNMAEVMEQPTSILLLGNKSDLEKA